MTYVYVISFVLFAAMVGSAELFKTQRSEANKTEEPFICRTYDMTECNTKGLCERDIVCHDTHHCFAVYRNDSETGKVEKEKLGCMAFESSRECESGHCMLRHNPASGSKNKLHRYLCCCKGSRCNLNMTFNEEAMQPQTTQATTGTISLPKKPNEKYSRVVLYYILVPVFGIVIVLGVMFYLWRKHKNMILTRRPLLDRTPPPTPPFESKPIQLLEIVSRGQFGCVYRANYEECEVAVKVIPHYERGSWNAEKSIYTDFGLDHENVLHFVAAEKRAQGLTVEFWILTEFHENGSLSDFLKLNTLDWEQCLTMVLSTVSGLMYLHTEMMDKDPPKPVIAHRDFKSRNVLVKRDLSCCIGDFGLACAFTADNQSDEAKAQVGTKRYMAPEVLQGAVMFQAESFLSIDMYALALVMWEIVSRCTETDVVAGVYKAPFEEEVGYHPSLEDMITTVVDGKIRPRLLQEWLENKNICVICETIEDCWDQDGDARLTAHCVYERLANLHLGINFSATNHYLQPSRVEIPVDGSVSCSNMSDFKADLTNSTSVQSCSNRETETTC